MPKKYNSYLVEFIESFNFSTFLKNNLPREELVYTSFGVFGIISTICTMYYISSISELRTLKSLLYIYESMLVLSVSIATYPVWPKSIKKDSFAQFIWSLSIFYLLIVCSSFFVMLSNFSSLEAVVFTINLIVVAILIKWKNAILMITVGLYLGSKWYKYYTGFSIEEIGPGIKSSSFILYAFLLIATAVIIFLKPKQEYQELTEEKAQHLANTIGYKDGELQKALTLKSEFIRNVTHEYHAPMTGIINTAEALLSSYEYLDDYGRKKAIENIYKSAVRLESFDANIRDLARLSSGEAEVNISSVNLSDLVVDRLNVCKKLYIENSRQNDYSFVTNIEDDVIAQADEYYLKQTLDNLITNAINYCKKGNIKLELAKKNNYVSFSITDQGIGIPKEELFDIFGEFTVSSKTRTPAGGRGVGLALCKKVLEMHKGTIWANSGSGETTFTFSMLIKFDDLATMPSEEILIIAKNLLKEGASVKLISKATGIRENRIKAL